MRLICQLQEGGLEHANLMQLYQALERLDEHSRSRCGVGKRKPLRSPALLGLDMSKLVADYESGIAPYSLAIIHGIDRETVAKRLRDVGVLGRQRLGQ